MRAMVRMVSYIWLITSISIKAIVAKVHSMNWEFICKKKCQAGLGRILAQRMETPMEDGTHVVGG